MRRLTYLFRFFFSPRQEAEFRRSMLERKKRKEIYLIKNNRKFKDKHKGERCFIIGNGPSVKDVDFGLLRNEVTFTVNQLPRLDRFSELNTTYHLWADERFFSLKPDDPGDMELLEVMKSVNTNNNKPTVFYKTTAFDMIKQYSLDEELNIEYYMDGGMGSQQSDIEYPLDRLVPVYATCIHYAIIIAVYMGFSEIYLLGCDCTGIINTINSRVGSKQDFEYAYTITANEKNRMMKVSKQTSIADEFEWYGSLLRTYGVMFDYAQRHNCRLYNATATSIIENVPAVDLDSVLSHRGVV